MVVREPAVAGTDARRPASLVRDPRRWWAGLSLAWQFFLAGGAVALLAMIAIGAWVTDQIEDSVTRNAAATTALYVDSVIAPLLPDMQTSSVIDETTVRALDETLSQGALASRLMSFRLWRPDGTVVYANDKSLVGRRFPVNDDVRAAFGGKVVARFGELDDIESGRERASGEPLLEIYNPVLQPWSGEVVAVSEFYEVARDLERDLDAARLRSWLAVAGATAVFFAILSAIVFRGSRTLDASRASLALRIAELSELLDQNRSLRMRVQRASERIATLHESHMRRVGADLHDGPAQLIALAALQLDSPQLVEDEVPASARKQEVEAVRASLDDALAEIRSICNGLVLPQIEAAELPDVLAQAVRAHERRSRSRVRLHLSEAVPELSAPEKICVYRFVQEALNNGMRHAPGADLTVSQQMDANVLRVTVEDNGPGFDPSSVRSGGLGLQGMRERLESLGGELDVQSSPGGTRVTMTLPLRASEAGEP